MLIKEAVRCKHRWYPLSTVLSSTVGAKANARTTPVERVLQPCPHQFSHAQQSTHWKEDKNIQTLDQIRNPCLSFKPKSNKSEPLLTSDCGVAHLVPRSSDLGRRRTPTTPAYPTITKTFPSFPISKQLECFYHEATFTRCCWTLYICV
jgi:hypothetical protein